ncbi:MAG: radical SAM protein [Smithella sp.]|jgi:hypothetical protein
MKKLYERIKNHADRTVRCYLTLNCNSHCSYCSAGLSSGKTYENHVNPDIWAEGLNRRKRDTILCGGEPFLYPHFNQLVNQLNDNYKIEIYTNLGINVEGFLKSARRKFRFLISLHTGITNFVGWYSQAEALKFAGNSVRFHVVKHGNWIERRDFLQNRGNKVTCCDDQCKYSKSNGKPPIMVKCKTQIYAYAPTGYRHSCVTQLTHDENRHEHISEQDSGDWFEQICGRFNQCVGCDNLIQGSCEEIE